MKKVFLLMLLAVSTMFGQLHAQAPYKHSIGVTFGTIQGVTYKTFLTDKLALSVDANTKLAFNGIWTVEATPNIMYEGNITNGLYGFIGGGFALGYCWNMWRNDDVLNDIGCGKFGVNAIMGLEYKFNAPITCHIDFRPGYGMLFDRRVLGHYFDWNLFLNFGVRYTF